VAATSVEPLYIKHPDTVYIAGTVASLVLYLQEYRVANRNETD